MKTIPTDFTKLMQIDVPIIGAPMFLVSNPDLVASVSNQGGLGAIPALNAKSSVEFETTLKAIKERTQKPFGVNLIVNQSNMRQEADLEICVAERVPFIITSLGNPKHTIEKMHRIGCKVFCDVTTLEHAQKVQALGADGVIAVGAGAGGHAGPISPLVLLPYLKKHLSIPIIAAGGIVTGEQLLATLILGASGVQIGTRFIVSHESAVDQSYKKAILNSEPEDIVLTKRISGTPASVINTDYVKQTGLELNWLEKNLLSHPKTKKWMKAAIAYIGAQSLKKAVEKTTWKNVWSAGQGVGLIEKNQSCEEIMQEIVTQYFEAVSAIRNNAPT